LVSENNVTYSNIITVNDLVFEYPGVRALNHVSFGICEGSITALVGPNGSGKTTLLRCLAGLEEPVSGSILFEDMDIVENPRICHKQIGYLSDFFGVYEDLTVDQCLCYMAMAHGIAKDRCKDAVNLVSKRLRIAQRLHDKAGALSRGLRQRLAIAQAIIHEPKMLLLDEPAAGLDPEARTTLSELFLMLRDQGMTLMVSSHILTELEEYSTEMLILKKGEIAGQRLVGNRKQILSLIRILLLEPATELRIVLEEFSGVSDIRIDGQECWFLFSGDAEARYNLLKYLIAQGARIVSFAEEKTDMQKEYLSVVRQSMNSEGILRDQ